VDSTLLPRPYRHRPAQIHRVPIRCTRHVLRTNLHQLKLSFFLLNALSVTEGVVSRLLVLSPMPDVETEEFRHLAGSIQGACDRQEVSGRRDVVYSQ
jgi:hypothetical protein